MKFSFEEFLEKNKPKNGRFHTVVIDGRGASGKSSFLEFIKPKLPDFTFLNFDDYFEPKDDIEAWGFLNKPRFAHDVIEPIKIGNNFNYKPYDWHSKVFEEKEIIIDRGVCLEGFLTTGFELDWDLKIWVEAPKEICLERGVARDKDQKDALHIWRDVWQPKEDNYIERIKPLETSDLIIDGAKPFENQIV